MGHGAEGMGFKAKKKRWVRGQRFEVKNIRRKVQDYLISDWGFRIARHNNLAIAPR